ncbi:MAG TPA: nitroreductase family deazaflavin-dependent oxidoreductase [Nitriliruptoraceae bacterium]|nr:nitroreductase family deazaflavin-dependent oxidoreductase [Nitriliruptoraceae bacterium]
MDEPDTDSDLPLPQRAIRQVAISPVGMWATSRWLYRIDKVVHRRTDGRHTLTSFMTGMPIAMVTTTGARSGQRRVSPLIALPTDDGVAVVGSNYGGDHHPGWVHNLWADPHGSLTVDDETWNFEAVEVEDDRRAEIWDAFARAWPGYARYEERAAPRRIAVFDLQRR